MVVKKQYSLGLVILFFVLSFFLKTPVSAQTTAATYTGPTASDQDDMAIWIHPNNPSASTIIGSDKSANKIFVYDLAGNTIQTLDTAGQPGNIDIRYNFPLSGNLVDIVVVNQRSNGYKLLVYQIDSQTGTLSQVDNGAITTGENYGSCLYKSPTANFYAVTTSKGGNIEQYQLTDDGAGKIKATQVRSWNSGYSEGCVVDDENQWIYISEEPAGIWKLGAEPSDATPGTIIASVGQNGLTADVEGLAIYHTGNSQGYLIASSQGSSDFKVYDRLPPHLYLSTFSTGTSSTDGIDVANVALDANFSQGMFISHNGGQASTLKAVRWQDIAQSTNPALTVDTSWNPRGQTGGGLIPTTTSIPDQPSPTTGINQPTNSPIPPGICSSINDLSCFEVWLSEFTAVITSKMTDFDNDSQINLTDFEIWRRTQYGGGVNSPIPTQPNTPSPTLTSTLPPPAGSGIWISSDEIAQLPISGKPGCEPGTLCYDAWNAIISRADSSWGTPNLSDYAGLGHSQGVWAGALAAKRLSFESNRQSDAQKYYDKTIQALNDVMGTETPALPSSGGGKKDGSLAIARQFPRYVLAADLLGITDWGPNYNGFTNFVDYMLHTKFTFRVDEGGHSLSEGGGKCASNGCAMAQAARTAAAAYLKDNAQLDDAWLTFRRYSGDYSSPVTIDFSSAGKNWYHDNNAKLAINPKGATCAGSNYPADGVIPNDQGRSGNCPSDPNQAPAPLCQDYQYPWEGLQGAYAAAYMLYRLGYQDISGNNPFQINDNALLRAVQYQWYLQSTFGNCNWYDTSRAAWVKHLAFKFYGYKPIQYVADDGGRNMSLTQWTNQ